MTKKKLEARVLKVTPEYKGFLTLNKYEIEKDLHEGGKQNMTWMVMERGHAVGILAYDPSSDEVILVNEMRPGILAAGDYPYTDTLPAGGIGKNETPIEAAVREMKEETGLDLKDPRIVHAKSYVSAGGTSESISIVFGIVAAKKAGGIHGLVEESENIKTTVLSSDEFMAQIRSGDINDMKTIIAGYWLMENRKEIQRDNHPESVFRRELGKAMGQAAGFAAFLDKSIEDAPTDWSGDEGGLRRYDMLRIAIKQVAAEGRFDLLPVLQRIAEEKPVLPAGNADRLYPKERLFREFIDLAGTSGNLTGWAASLEKGHMIQDMLLDRLRYQAQAEALHDRGAMQELIRFIKKAGRDNVVDAWIKEAQEGVKSAEKSPDMEHQDHGHYGGPSWIEKGGNLKRAKENLAFCERLRAVMAEKPAQSKKIAPPSRKR